MSDTVFTPDERGEMPDPVTRRPGHRTESIVLADEAEYSLNGKRQDGFQEIVSKINTPFIMRVKAEFSQGDHDLAQQYDVSGNKTVVATAWAVVSNVVTLTVSMDHGLKVNQWIKVDQDGVTTATLAAAALGTFQLTDVTDTTVVYAATTGDASATENVNARYQKVRMLDQAEAKVIYSDSMANSEDRVLSAAQLGSYRVFASDGTSAQFDSDGTTMNLRGTVAGYTDTNATVSTINLDIGGLGNVRIENNSGGTLTIRIEYSGGAFSDVDQDLFMCLFEKDKEIILKNRTGASRTCALEGIQANVAARVTASPAQLPAEHPQF